MPVKEAREKEMVPNVRRGRSRRSKFRGGAFCPRDALPSPFLPRLDEHRSRRGENGRSALSSSSSLLGPLLRPLVPARGTQRDDEEEEQLDASSTRKYSPSSSSILRLTIVRQHACGFALKSGSGHQSLVKPLD